MLRVLVTIDGGNERDYTKYVDFKTLQLVNKLSVPSQLTITFYQNDSQFVAPFERCYVKLVSTKNNKTLFTGYVAATPDQQRTGQVPVGMTLSGQAFRYTCTVTSDEYLLNFKYIEFIPAFVNQTQGQILAQLANILCPGFFDVSLMQPGFLVPYFVYDPTQTWSTIAKQFCDAARYYYYVRDKKIVFAPYNDNQLGIAYDEINQRSVKWNSSKLQTTVLQTPTVNDVTIIGDVEAGVSHDDYYIGDGFTGEWGLNYGTYQAETSLLLEDDFTNTEINTQNWALYDPQHNLDFSAGALNVVSPLAGPALTGLLVANNGIELAGGLDLQHGEFQWNDKSIGEVGGIYFDASVVNSLASWKISTPGTVTLTASGAGGIAMQPAISGQLVGTPLISQPNHHYVLWTKIACPAETRFQQTFSTKDGSLFGGQVQSEFGVVTFVLEDVDIGATFNQALTGIYNFPISTFHTFSVSGVNLPAYAAYALIKNNRLNLTTNYCLLSKTPAGSLSIAGSLSGAFLPTGAILPFLGPEAEYAGAVSPYLSGQIILSSGVTGALAPPMPLQPAHNYTLGFGLDQQTASIVRNNSGNNVDTLGFFLDTTPAAGSRIKFRSNEANRSFSRVLNEEDILAEAALVGDDGRRAAVVTNLSPLPRTSEDCDAAAQAYLYDHGKIFYNGTYIAEDDLFQQDLDDFPFWPVPGRFLNVNSPARSLNFTDFLVTQVTTTVLDSLSEKLTFNLQFGADTRTEKLLAQFVQQQPTGIFSEQDAANLPLPQTIAAIFTGTYMPDIVDTDCPYIIDNYVWCTINSPYLSGSASSGPVVTPENFVAEFVPVVYAVPVVGIIRGRPIVGPTARIEPTAGTRNASTTGYNYVTGAVQIIQAIGPAVSFPQQPSQAAVPGSTAVEIRESNGSWGKNSANLIARYYTNAFTLLKNNYDQTWYMRLVQFDTNGNVSMMSRRTKVIRVKYPFRPAAAPNIIFNTTVDMQLDFTGDQRNIYGIEVRMGDDNTIIFQQECADTTDLYFNFQNILPQLQAIATTFSPTATASFLRGYTARFFNAQWLYGPKVSIYTPPPPAPNLSIGVRFSQLLQVNSDIITRDDILSQTFQVSDEAFFGRTILPDMVSRGQQGMATFTVPSTGDLYVRSKRTDLLGDGAWSNTLFIPRGDLIASDYLATQGSVPPVVTQNSESLFTYVSTDSSITITSISFAIAFPNGNTTTVPASSATYTSYDDGSGTLFPLQPASNYLFYPRILDPDAPDVQILWGRIYSQTPPNLPAMLIADGTVLLTNSAITVTTATGNGGGGTSGGSTGGSSTPIDSGCAEKSSRVRMAYGGERRLDQLVPGDLVWGGGILYSEIKTLDAQENVELFKVTTDCGRSMRVSESHAFRVNGHWTSTREALEAFEKGERLTAYTERGEEPITSIEPDGRGDIVMVRMKGKNKTYFVNGFESHNMMFKAANTNGENQ